MNQEEVLRLQALTPAEYLTGDAVIDLSHPSIEQISDGVYFVTLDRRITYLNGGAERITGYCDHEVLGHSCAEGILRHIDETGRQLRLEGCPLAAVMIDGKPREAASTCTTRMGIASRSRCGAGLWGTPGERLSALSSSSPPGE